MSDNVAAVILAAGMGTRMKSDKAKVLHELNGKAMITYVIESVTEFVGQNLLVVIGYQAEKVRKEISMTTSDAIFVLQKEQLGTGHALLCAVPQIPENIDCILVSCGDIPLLTADTLKRLIVGHRDSKREITVLAGRTDTPSGYGRILFDENGELREIVEEADATEEQKRINIINSGIYCISTLFLHDALEKIQPKNNQKEFYLTDIVKIGYKEKKSVGVVLSDDFEEFMGVNTLRELSIAEGIMQKRISFNGW